MEFSVSETVTGEKSVHVTLTPYELLRMVKDEGSLYASFSKEGVITEVHTRREAIDDVVVAWLADAVDLLNAWDDDGYMVHHTIRYEGVLGYVLAHARMREMKKRDECFKHKYPAYARVIIPKRTAGWGEEEG